MTTQMAGWVAFSVAFAVFFLTHSLPLRPQIKARLTRYLGAGGFTILYSAVSLGALGVLIVAAKNAPYVELWSQQNWHRSAAFAGMLVVCILVAVTIGRPNPFSFGGTNNDAFDPDHPGIVRWFRHPLLMALSLWAALHLLPNGDLAHVILFGVFLAFSLLGSIMIDRRKRRFMGADRWDTLRRKTKRAPLIQRPSDGRTALVRIALGFGAFSVLLLLHPVVLGVSPLPM